MSEQITQMNGIEICSESFGNPADPPVLLIMGAMCSMVYWDAEFCQRLADTGRYVIRYDNRDVGRSTTNEPGKLEYNAVDMANDAVGVLDAYGIDQAHIVGLSLGGMIAQLISVNHPQRVLTITMIGTGSIFESELDNEEVPPMDERILAYHASGAELDWSDDEVVANYLVKGSSLLCGSGHRFDEQRAYKLALTEIKRANHLLSMYNHALLGSSGPYEGSLKDIAVPALVIHGTEDTVCHFGGATILVNEISDASLLALEGTGHEIHFDDWDQIIDAIVKHTSVV
ncbi:alpha/beta fold hydrolase [Paenibacillus sp. 481]|uniref:alpha/beta fold hydrolase n=1 Tax=Paenibacillus sp. 481 TaxID=2835869 RepID=UPI001E283EDD|nr:alpha/beta hydrolase [Paenibacillus sp. 481]UHA72891.1 alpha/beta hydrolase [Paenibacillus sp. 481]